MKSIIIVIFIIANDITAKTINIKTQRFCNEPLSNITDLSDDNYDSKEQDTPATDQVKYAALEQKLETEREEQLNDSDINEHSNDGNIELNPTTKVTENVSKNKKLDTDINSDNSTSLQVIEVNSKYTMNGNVNSNENSTNIHNTKQNNKVLESHSDITNIREVRSQLLNHLLEYFMNIIKEEKHSETRKKYSKDKMKLEDKLRNYYHSDLDQLFYDDGSDFYENDTEYSNGRRKTEREDAIVDKQSERDDVTNLDDSKNIQLLESEATKIVEETQNESIPDIIKESNTKEGIAINNEPSDLFLQNTNAKEPAIATEDNLTDNKENKIPNTEKSATTLPSNVVEDDTQVGDKYDTELTKEQTKQSEIRTDKVNNVNETEEADPFEDNRRNQNSHTSQIDKNNSRNSEEKTSDSKPTHTWLRQIFFGLDKNDSLDEAPKNTSGCCKNNYILQINIQL